MAPLTIEKLPRWTEEAARGLGESLGDDAVEIAHQVDAGLAELWSLDRDTYMVTRIHHTASKHELVVCCLAGHGLRDITPLVLEAARRLHLQGVRCHVQRPGMARLLAPFGFRERERVLFAEVRP